MSPQEVIIRLSASYDLKVRVGDKVCAGTRLREGPDEDGLSAAPVAGVVAGIRFDAGRHEFVVRIVPADQSQST